jgi:hypothetical protein
MRAEELRFLPRWRQLEETAFTYAERAAQAPGSTERDRLTHLALSAWRAGTGCPLAGEASECARQRREVAATTTSVVCARKPETEVQR